MIYEIRNLYLEHIKVEELKDKLDKLDIVDYYAFILHDKDINEDTGEIKKPHYHCIVDINCNIKNNNQRKLHIIEKLRPIIYEKLDIQGIKNENTFTRYLIHLDNKEKYQYNRKEIFTNNLTRLETALEPQRITRKSDTNGFLLYLIGLVKNRENIDLVSLMLAATLNYNCGSWFINNRRLIINDLQELYKYRTNDYIYFKPIEKDLKQ